MPNEELGARRERSAEDRVDLLPGPESLTKVLGCFIKPVRNDAQSAVFQER